MSDQGLDRSVLDGKDREELHQIAGAMGVQAPTRMKKADLIDAILGASGDGNAPAGDISAASGGSDGGDRPKRVRSRRTSESDDPMDALAAEEEAIAAAGDGADIPAEPRPDSPPGRRPVPRPEGGATAAGRPARPARGPDTSASATPTKEARAEPKGGDGDGSGPRTAPRIEAEDERQSYGEGNRRRRRRRGRDRQQDGEPREFQGEPVETQELLALRDEGHGFLRTTTYLPGPNDPHPSPLHLPPHP